MNIHIANMFDSRNLNLRLFTNAIKLDKQVDDSYIGVNMIFFLFYQKGLQMHQKTHNFIETSFGSIPLLGNA